jgi:FkbM family methyltransferase
MISTTGIPLTSAKRCNLLQHQNDYKPFFVTEGHLIKQDEWRFPTTPFEAQRELIYKLKNTNLKILDVGANNGQTARSYRSMFPDSEIYCFEAFPASIQELHSAFSCDKKIHIVPMAVAREKGVKIFYVNEYDATNSLLPRPASSRRYYPIFAGPKETIEVESTDIDGFLRDNNISNIDIFKLDIQGGELNALMGATSLLESGDLPIIYTEIMFIPHYDKCPLFHELCLYLSKFGYSLFNMYDLHRATNGQLRYGDALFVSELVRNNVINNYQEEP